MITDWTEEILDLQLELSELETRVEKIERKLMPQVDEPESTEGYPLAAPGNNPSEV